MAKRHYTEEQRQKHNAYVAEAKRRRNAQGAEIGEIPPVEDPKRRADACFADARNPQVPSDPSPCSSWANSSRGWSLSATRAVHEARGKLTSRHTVS